MLKKLSIHKNTYTKHKKTKFLYLFSLLAIRFLNKMRIRIFCATHIHLNQKNIDINSNLIDIFIYDLIEKKQSYKTVFLDF
jgi:hypothetical protein